MRSMTVERPATMESVSTVEAGPASQTMLRTGHILSALGILFFLFDGGIKALELAPAVEGTVQLGYPASIILGLGIVQLACLALYAVPRTSVLGAMLLTGYLGGAVATHVRIGNPVFSHILFPVYLGALIWGALLLRDARLRGLLSRRPQ